MIVHQPIINSTDSEVQVSAAVELQTPRKDFPDDLWFKFPARFQDAVTHRADGFAAGLLLPAMLLGEPLEIHGIVSPKLFYGLQETQKIYHSWYPGLFSPIQIHCEKLVPMNIEQVQGGVATAFSGGVDSFYTLWSHLEQNQPLKDYQITYCLFTQGFDLSLVDRENFQILRDKFHELLQPLDIQLITCQTNIHAFTAQLIRWETIYGPALAATALVLGRLLNRYYISSVQPYHMLSPTGSSPISDHFLSSETLDVIHAGAGKSRLEKLAVLSNWPVARENLRVCTDAKKRLGTRNCSRCDKCLRTMTMLKIIGSYQKFTTFDPAFKALSILRWSVKYISNEPWVKQTADFAVYNHQFGYLPLLYFVGLMGWLRHQAIRLLPRWLFHRLKKHFYPPEENIFSHQYIKKTGSKL